MPIHFLCPYGHRLVVPDDRAGKKGRCPVCHQKVYVPVADPRPSGRKKKPSQPVGAQAHPGGGLQPTAPPSAAPSNLEPDNFISVDVDALLTTDEWKTAHDTAWRQPLVERSAGEWRQMTWLLAGGILALAGLGLVAVWQRPLSDGPAWIMLVWAVTVAQVAYALTLGLWPDRRALWFGSWLLAAVAALYAMAATIVYATPADTELALGMQSVRDSAGGWCVGQATLIALLASSCGALAARQKPHGTAAAQPR